jgi:hypothetical protein
MESLYRDYAVVGGPTEIAAIAAGWWLVCATGELCHAVIAALKLAAFTSLAVGAQKGGRR